MEAPIRDVRKRAESGDPFAQTLLGFLLEHGLRMAPDADAAREWYSIAAGNDYPPAQYALSQLLSQSEAAVSLDWLRRAAEAGYPAAQFLLGYSYDFGHNTEADHDLALHWMKLAADGGFIPAMVHLSFKYHEGMWVSKDSELDLKYTRQAAELGDATAAFSLGSRLVQDEDKEAVAEGLKWIRKAAKKDNHYAYSFLARMYAHGLYGVPVDKEIASVLRSRGQIKPTDYT